MSEWRGLQNMAQLNADHKKLLYIVRWTHWQYGWIDRKWHGTVTYIREKIKMDYINIQRYIPVWRKSLETEWDIAKWLKKTDH